MKKLYQLKKYFRPIQPSIKTENRDIIYQEAIPEKDVESFIYCFWQLKTEKPLKHPFIYRVVSDGCIDIFFNHKNPTENFIMGFCRKYTEFPIGHDFDYIGIRFLPSAFPLIFKINAKSLSNQSQQLVHVLPNFTEWMSLNINSKQSFEKIVNLLNDKLGEIVHNRKLDYDARFFDSLSLIFQKKGYLEIESGLNTGLSSRQLRRVFNYFIGTTPKAFSNVVRFQNVLNAQVNRQDLKNNKLYYDFGFYDQAHFIKQFKTFYGVTPSEAYR